MALVVTDQIRAADRERNLISRANIQAVEERATMDAALPVKNVLVLNLMPKKEPAMTDLSLALGGAQDYCIQPTFLNVEVTKHQDADGRNFCEINFPLGEYAALLESRDFTGVIFNGASLGDVPFENTAGLDDLKTAMDLGRARTGGVFNICWSAMAGLYLDHSVQKQMAPQKIIGVFDQVASVPHGLTDAWGKAAIPCGRFGYIPDENIKSVPALDILAVTPQMLEYDLGTSASLIEDKAARTVYMINHPEYGPSAVRKEYERDRDLGAQGGFETPYPVGNFDIPKGQDAPWKNAAHRLFNAWIKAISVDEKVEAIANDNRAPAQDAALDFPVQMRL